ncbi:hypothetical protein PB2503_11494 [Parvularcula bermudensis HTCC2503]|uniref:DUF4345 domain-containing protein n=1 Tax=Parvularcula bermudensis (strain ATCC BAA-594 / HTCC2503 / KCTC 12087) TaxID=314260 RepID=E0TCW1_PARBH|nr:hypothetical protein [Parvularcula bermudensis]ADM10344.1 hypothetical protein PB2503_11494 [Parvularcula bermudensis HTCC2503]
MGVLLDRVVLLAAVGFFLIGANALVAPDWVAGILGLSVTQESGMNAIRAIIGGHYLAMALMVVFGFFLEESRFLVAIIMIEGLMIFSRLVGLLAGEGGVMVFAPLVIEIALVVILFPAAARLRSFSRRD